MLIAASSVDGTLWRSADCVQCSVLIWTCLLCCLQVKSTQGMEMEPFRKIRIAHTPKSSHEQKKMKKKIELVEQERLPKVVASGTVTHEPLFTSAQSVSDDEEAKSFALKHKIKLIPPGLRRRPADLVYDESLLTLKSLRNGLKRSLENGNCDFKCQSKIKKKKSSQQSSSSQREDKKVEMLLEKCTSNNPPPEDTFVRPCKNTVDWDYYLEKPENLQNIPPVEYFPNAPLVDIWDDIAKVGLAIELRNPFVKGREDVFWLATIVYFIGYKALVKFETFDEESSSDYVAYVSFCSDVPRYLGWCYEHGKQLKPGPVVKKSMSTDELSSKIKEFMERPTINRDHEQRLYRAIKDRRRISQTLPVEVMDKDSLTENRLGRIIATMGNRVLVAYYADKTREEEKNDPDGKRGYWYNSYNSESVHPLGWSHTVGVPLRGGDNNALRIKLPPESFPSYPQDLVKIRVGMYLETRHPIKLYSLVVAKIVKVFNHGYFMVETKDTNKATRVQFIYHVTSPFVLPVGFGASHGIKVDCDTAVESLAKVNQLRVDLLPPKPANRFQFGHKVEVIDILDGKYCAPATVIKVAGHLLLLYFDGWRKDIGDNYQWVDVETSDIYPCGYREMMGIEWHGYLEESDSLNANDYPIFAQLAV